MKRPLRVLEPCRRISTLTPDKDDRKKARRQRIEKKYEEESGAGDSQGKEQGTNRTGGQRNFILLHLDRRKHKGVSEVTVLCKDGY